MESLNAVWIIRRRAHRSRRAGERQPHLQRLHRLHLRSRRARFSQRVPRRAPLHRFWPGLGDAELPDLSRREDDKDAPRHCRARAALAQPGAPRRTGRDPRPVVERPLRFRGRQGLSLGRVSRLLHPDGGGRGTLSGDARLSAQGAWTSGGRFSHHGKYWHYEDVVIEPAPVQKPHPPFWIGAASPNSIRYAAEQGYNLLLGQGGGPDTVAEGVSIYRRAVEAQGRAFDTSMVGLTRALHIAMNENEREAALALRAQFMGQGEELSLSPTVESPTLG